MTTKKEQQAAVYVGTHGLMRFVAELSHRMAQEVHRCEELGDFLPQEVRSEFNQLHEMQRKLTWMLARLSKHQQNQNEMIDYRRDDR